MRGIQLMANLRAHLLRMLWQYYANNMQINVLINYVSTTRHVASKRVKDEWFYWKMNRNADDIYFYP